MSSVGQCDPNRFFLHTKHILNNVEEAVFRDKVLVRINPNGFGCIFNFPPVAHPAHLLGPPQQAPAGGAPPAQPPAPAPTGKEVAAVLARAQRKSEPARMPDQSPPCRTLASDPNPRVLQDKDFAFFTIREFLTLRELFYVAQCNRRCKALALDDYQYWQKKIKTLCITRLQHVYLPLNNQLLGPDTLRRWYKVLYSQQQLAHYKMQLDKDLPIANQLEEPIRDETVSSLTTIFRRRTHPCGLCSERVTYGHHLDKNIKKVISIIQMTCDKCFNTKLWSTKKVTILWGISVPDLETVPAWRIDQASYYTTQDLLEAVNRIKPFRNRKAFKPVAPEIAEQWKYLPKLIQDRTIIFTHNIDDDNAVRERIPDGFYNGGDPTDEPEMFSPPGCTPLAETSLQPYTAQRQSAQGLSPVISIVKRSYIAYKHDPEFGIVREEQKGEEQKSAAT